MADVVVVGGGMCGLAAAFNLVRLGVRNLRVLDRSEPGREGPWVTYARMETLRSPKGLTGPASGLGALTFRAWYEARRGRAAWEALGRIPRPEWMTYLRWYRRVLALPVENGVEVASVSPPGDARGLLRLALRHHVRGGAAAREETLLARKVVLATGRAGLGRPSVPGFAWALPRHLWAHSSEAIDFDALRGRRVVVVGAGASAMDNAAEAAERGAAEVRLLVRRAEMPRVNHLMAVGGPGFTAGFPRLDDAWRWRFMRFAAQAATPAPRGSTLRLTRQPNAHVHLGSGVRSAEAEGDALRVETARGRVLRADFLIAATGFEVDARAVPAIADFAGEIETWADRYTPPPDLADPALARSPYLAPSFAFRERVPGRAPFLADVHCFNHAAALSLGKVSGDIPGVSEGAAWLAEAIAGELFARDVDQHWRKMTEHATPELLGDEWCDAEAADALAGGSVAPSAEAA